MGEQTDNIPTWEEVMADASIVLSKCCNADVTSECTDDTCYVAGTCCTKCHEWCDTYEVHDLCKVIDKQACKHTMVIPEGADVFNS